MAEHSMLLTIFKLRFALAQYVQRDKLFVNNLRFKIALSS